MSRRLMRFVQLLLHPEPQSPTPIYSAECLTCGEQSESADGKAPPEEWCLSHAGRTHHMGFRTLTTGYVRVIAEEGAVLDPLSIAAGHG